MRFLVFLTCCLLPSIASIHEKHLRAFPNFPDDFMFGVATSSYQTEGAWMADGKGLSMWDYFVHTNPEAINDRSNADDACKSYYLYKRDIEMLKELGVKTYRFSISWPRILPDGRTDYVNPKGIAHYNEVINELIANDIVPFVTMYHWELPQSLSERGGWLNEDIVEWFGDYARILFQNFGDRVKYWLTINEPHIHCKFAYGIGLHAPQVLSEGTGIYDCGRHILLASARAYHIYNDEFRNVQNGKIAPVFSMNWPEPATDSQDDADAVITSLAFSLEQYANPFFSEQGNYPQLMIDRVAAASAAEGLNSSRLRPLTEEQINYIKGSADFFALNTYGTDIVYRNESVEGMFVIPSMSNDGYYAQLNTDHVPMNGSHDLLEYVPGFYKLLNYIKDNYNDPPIYVTENGFPTFEKGLVVDDERVAYIRNYLTALLAAISNGVNVKGYIIWNLMDSFEWNRGYTRQMGLYNVDMEDPNRTRVPRKSAFVYKEIIRSKSIDYDYDPFESSDSSTVKPSIFGLLITSLLIKVISSRIHCLNVDFGIFI